MLKFELLELIANGKNSGVEFKRDDLRPEQVAKEIVALANFQGGKVLLGVENDGTISDIQRLDLMDTVFCRYVHPLILPFYEELTIDDGRGGKATRDYVGKDAEFRLTDDSFCVVIPSRPITESERRPASADF